MGVAGRKRSLRAGMPSWPILAGAAAALMLAAGASGGASATTSQIWVAARAPLPAGASATSPGVQLTSVACPAVSVCVAVGDYNDSAGNGQGLLLTRSGGTWHARRAPLPRDASASPRVGLTSVACPTRRACVAVGSYFGKRTTRPLLLARSGSSWRVVPAPLPPGAPPGSGGSLQSVVCPAANRCVISGDVAIQPMLATGFGSSWKAITAPLPKNALAGGVAAISSLDCPAPSQCVAVGSYVTTRRADEGMLLTGAGTSWRAAEAPVPPDAITGSRFAITLLGRVSCASASRCVAVGVYLPRREEGREAGLLLSRSGPAWHPLRAPLPPHASINGNTILNAVNCRGSQPCTVAGSYDAAGGERALLLTGFGSSWRPANAPLPARAASSIIDSMGCGPSVRCVALGRYSPPPQGLLLTRAVAGWRAFTAPLPGPGTTFYVGNAASCPSPDLCVAVGTYTDAENAAQGLLITGPG